MPDGEWLVWGPGCKIPALFWVLDGALLTIWIMIMANGNITLWRHETNLLVRRYNFVKFKHKILFSPTTTFDSLLSILLVLRGSRFLRALLLVHLLSNHIQFIELCPLSILITGLVQNLPSPLSQVRLLAYKNFSKEAVGFAFLFPFLISFWGNRDREGGWKHNDHFLVLIIDAFLLTWVDCGCCLCARCPESDSLMEYIISS